MNAMRSMRALVAGVLLAGLWGLPTLAFQEQQGGTAAPAESAAPAQPAQDSKTPAVDFSAPDMGAEADRGTEVSIPGLGKLGVLPKMNFGLELLYGANEQPER